MTLHHDLMTRPVEPVSVAFGMHPEHLHEATIAFYRDQGLIDDDVMALDLRKLLRENGYDLSRNRKPRHETTHRALAERWGTYRGKVSDILAQVRAQMGIPVEPAKIQAVSQARAKHEPNSGQNRHANADNGEVLSQARATHEPSMSHPPQKSGVLPTEYPGSQRSEVRPQTLEPPLPPQGGASPSGPSEGPPNPEAVPKLTDAPQAEGATAFQGGAAQDPPGPQERDVAPRKPQPPPQQVPSRPHRPVKATEEAIAYIHRVIDESCAVERPEWASDTEWEIVRLGLLEEKAQQRKTLWELAALGSLDLAKQIYGTAPGLFAAWGYTRARAVASLLVEASRRARG